MAIEAVEKHASLEAVVIGASAGALEALSVIIPFLPADYSLPVLVVVHIPQEKDSLMTGLLSQQSSVAVLEAEDKQPIMPATVYLAPPNYHLLVEKDGHLSLSNDEPVQYARPSVDVLFETAADAYGPNLLAILLTGANEDGARGMKAVLQAGGEGIVQDPASALVPVMPKAALDECPQVKVMSLDEIGKHLRSRGRG